ncbi:MULTISPECIES: hypothetical protein [unclassified Flavobacterium]|jgi:hypothetical protein|uniref:hypothetical protein n=1 Tax=unclassified Flavobacterium TaxID=196869 RepID=UPI0025BE299D|nr:MULTISPECIES: hypothetical protein [unclassified Flavobacterium]
MGFFTSKPKKKALQILEIEITDSLLSKLVETQKLNGFTDYSIEISEKFKLFDIAIFRSFENTKELTNETSFNLILENKNQSITINKVKELVNSFSAEYGNDRNGKSKWTNEDDKAISTYWEGREWILDSKRKSQKVFEKDCCQINFHFNLDDGVDFSILGANSQI